jgi:predicted outer membrane repeat protein
MFDGCTFDGNSASDQGGALYLTSPADIYLSDSVFTDNTAGAEGGAIYFYGNTAGTNAWIDRCLFAGNSASSGGAVYTRQGDYEFANCTFSGNLATGQAGAVRTYYDGHPTFTNCTFGGNRAANGGAIYSASTTGYLSIRNCILWSNDSSETVNDQIDATDLTDVEVQYTDIGQAFDSFYNQVGVIHTDPYFTAPVSASAAPTSTGDYHIQSTSPCEGQASATFAPDDDIDRDSRPRGTGDDMGSDEISEGGALMLDEPVTASMPVPSDESTHSGPSTSALEEDTSSDSETMDSGFLLVTQSDAGGVVAGSSTTSALGTGDATLSKRETGSESSRLPGLPATALGGVSLLALGWKALLKLLA